MVDTPSSQRRGKRKRKSKEARKREEKGIFGLKKKKKKAASFTHLHDSLEEEQPRFVCEVEGIKKSTTWPLIASDEARLNETKNGEPEVNFAHEKSQNKRKRSNKMEDVPDGMEFKHKEKKTKIERKLPLKE